MLQDSFSFLVLYNYIIPISLYVTLEFQKFFGSLFLVWDLQLFDPDTNQPAKCNSSDLNEELGLVEYLFSDKTGTLTENVMVFKKCSIHSQLLVDTLDHQLVPSTNSDLQVSDRKVRKFLEMLALCHTVQVAPKRLTKSTRNFKASLRDPNEILYNASSPDEKAIVEACSHYGVTFLGEREENGKVFIKLLSKGRKSRVFYEKLHTLEFDSDRKRMSVIVKDPKGQIRLITKVRF